MSANHRYTWLVAMVDGSVQQVDADLAAVQSDGSLVFTRNPATDPEGYIAVAMRAGIWTVVDIMSQMTGEPSQRTELRASRARVSP